MFRNAGKFFSQFRERRGVGSPNFSGTIIGLIFIGAPFKIQLVFAVTGMEG
jgi:hypothetical protein